MSIFTKKTDEQKRNDEKYKQTLSCVEKCMTEVIMNYFIFNISIVLNNKEIEHTKIKKECLIKILKGDYNLSVFSKEPKLVVDIIYNKMFGENGILLDNYLFKIVCKGAFKRIISPSNNEIYYFVINCISKESQNKYNYFIDKI